MVGSLVSETPVKVLGLDSTIEICWAEGQIGVLPVFEFKKDAKAYQKKFAPHSEIAELEEVKEKE